MVIAIAEWSCQWWSSDDNGGVEWSYGVMVSGSYPHTGVVMLVSGVVSSGNRSAGGGGGECSRNEW